MRKNKRGGAGGPATDRANASPLRNASRYVRRVVPQSLLRNKLPLAACLLLLLLPCVSKAQAPPNPDAFPTPIRNNSFTFVGNLSASYVLLPLSRRTQPYPITQAWNGYQNVSSNGIITSWNGVLCPYWFNSTLYQAGTGFDPVTGDNICSGPDAGAIQLTGQATLAGIEPPFQLGFPNNGFLTQCCSLVYSTINWLPRPCAQAPCPISDGTQVGDLFSFSGVASPDSGGYGYGVSFSFTEIYHVYSITTRSIRFVGLVTSANYSLVSASGVAVNPNVPAQ